ncbi:MAG: class I SAM-dependent methyltransferase [Acidaminococcales bacterium]|jgi:predicted RNA methylase|nr:class I SAM-dependent methyltransferase [Acidaminococcales bacterium]
MNLTPEVADILVNSKIDGNALFLPEGQLERKLYLSVNKALELLGGKWNRSKKGHVFADDPAERIDTALLTGKIEDTKKIFQFFPTPPEIAAIVCRKADINPDCDVLEPSAGEGGLLSEIKKYKPRSVTAVELDISKNIFLRDCDYSYAGMDFLQWLAPRLYDRVVMNPPFMKKQDIKHILRAWELLKPGGILCAVCSPSPFFCQDSLSASFRDWVETNAVETLDFPAGAFKASGTSIRTRFVKAVRR